MKTLATLHAKELYEVIRFHADTSDEHIPDPDGRGREPVLTMHTQCGFSFFSFFGSRGFPQGYRSECNRYTGPRCGKLLVNLVRNAGDTFYTSYGGCYVPTSTNLYLIEGKDFVDVNRALESVVLAYFVKGQAKVCIEVNTKQKAIVQAKLPCNRIVGEDPEMLTIIKNWARRKRLAVATLDMEEVTAANAN